MDAASTSITMYAKHSMETTRLTPEFATIKAPPGLNAVLYPHQEVVVAALLDMENARKLHMQTPGTFKDFTESPVWLETSAATLAEPYGSGKTLEILAFIMHRPQPKPISTPKVYYNPQNSEGRRYRTNIFNNEIRRQFTGVNTLLTSNVIVVGNSVLVQWQKAIAHYAPGLKVFSISDSSDLVKFNNEFNKNRTWISQFDIVLVKNGNVASKFTLPGELRGPELRPIIDTVGKITRECCWARVFYDDYDTINILPNTIALNTLFTIYVSATQDHVAPRRNVIKYANIIEALRERGSTITSAATDSYLTTNCSIRCRKSFIEESMSITVIDAFRYVYPNPDDVYIDLLGAMGDNNDLVEMLNGDAIETAADRMGIKTSNVADIFGKVLDGKYEKLLHSKTVLERIAELKVIHDGLPPHEEGKSHTDARIRTICEQLTRTTDPIPDAQFRSGVLSMALNELETEYIERRDGDSIAIDRVIDNVREGSCQVCCLPLEGDCVFILKCCGLIQCSICGVQCNKLGVQYDYKLRKNHLMGKCAMCMADLIPHRDMIFVDRNFNLEDLVNAKGDERGDESIIMPKIAEKPTEIVKNPKLRALLAIVNGEEAEAQERVPDIDIPGLVKGKKDIPGAVGMRKIVVFASYDETLRNIEKFLCEQKITFARLEGTPEMKADTVIKFRDTDLQVLLINAQHQCAGLNLQFCTDLVYFHAILNPNVLGQIAGRLQRIGRTSNARFHFLCYPNERSIL